MRRVLYVTAAAALACASQQRTSDTTAAPTAATPGQAAQPGSLSPEQVRLVQRSLADRGFAVDLSGRYDASTQRAVSDFQRARGLPASGGLDAATVQALGLDPRDVMPVRGDATTSGSADTSGTWGHGSTRDPNPQGSMNAAPPSSTGGTGTNTSTPEAPTHRRDLHGGGTGSTDVSGTPQGRSGHDADVNPEGTLRPSDPGASQPSGGTGTNTGGPTAPSDNAPHSTR